MLSFWRGPLSVKCRLGSIWKIFKGDSLFLFSFFFLGGGEWETSEITVMLLFKV